ncbi:helix-turn-helix domain-containing protein [Actinomadura chibensis]|uniref:Helix-turn-helix domain-containing protein n=1 Tax=Actinomadura chibensis TaxID=392828 RepID=A0A5D0NTQ6_9ACTN|nr:helix-turn-helix transcriptional regulator [Actinomadura chibensis]TYB48070.1 helix-turn-helix domain-containing protein [Actinomadura chibensis]
MASTIENRRHTPELRSFGAVVRRLREAAGLKQVELATAVNVSRAYIGHVELGKTRCRLDFAKRLDSALHANGEIVSAWNELIESIKSVKYAAYFIDFPRAESTASLIRDYETHIVNGLFQTEAYAKVIIKDPDIFNTRMNRQKQVMGDPAPKIFVVLEESVLHRQIGTREVMREQLEYLLELSERPGIRLQVLPTVYVEDARAAFAIATQRDRSEAAYLVTGTGGLTSADPDELANLNERFASLQAEALNVRDTRALIRKVIEERWT